MTRSVAERFWQKVDAKGDCWEWTGAIVAGYGQFFVGGPERRRARAHRFVWELLVGAIPDGLTIDHLCRNKACVNPDHLEPTTMQENNARGFSGSARNARKRYCKRGHRLAGDNVYRPPNGERICRECKRMHRRAYKTRKAFR